MGDNNKTILLLGAIGLLCISLIIVSRNLSTRRIDLSDELADTCVSLYKHSYAMCINHPEWDNQKCYDALPTKCSELNEYTKSNPGWMKKY